MKGPVKYYQMPKVEFITRKDFLSAKLVLTDACYMSGFSRVIGPSDCLHNDAEMSAVLAVFKQNFKK